MEEDQLENILLTVYNIKTDIILGKNLHRHLIDVSGALQNTLAAIEIAKTNNEATAGLCLLIKELLIIGNEIVDQLENNS